MPSLSTFADYMDQALYGPRGYYSSGLARTGRAGDYFTAPDVSPVFGRILAAIFCHWADEFAARPFHLVEMGAGEGALAQSVAQALVTDHRSQLAELAYAAIERSPARRERLEALRGAMPCRYAVHPDLSHGSRAPVTGCFFANELVDAFAVHRVRMWRGRLEEAFVSSDDDRKSGPQWVWGPPSTDAVAAYFDRLRIRLPQNYETEINLQMRAWIHEVAAALACGLVVVIDYGWPAQAYYDPERSQGTLRGFSRHEVRRDVLSPGVRDMTADVDFTSLALDARDAGLEPLAFMDMGAFLTWGARQVVENAAGRDPAGEPSAASTFWGTGSAWAGFRYLVHPEGLGSSFHVLVLGKGIAAADWRFEGNRLARLGIR